MRSVARSQGVSVPRDFSARKLFQRITSSTRPMPAMIRAVTLLKEAGIVYYLCRNLVPNGFSMHKIWKVIQICIYMQLVLNRQFVWFTPARKSCCTVILWANPVLLIYSYNIKTNAILVLEQNPAFYESNTLFQDNQFGAYQ